MVLNKKIKNTIAPYPSLRIKDMIKNIISFENEKGNNLALMYGSKNIITYSRSTYSIYKVFEFLNKFYNKKNIFIPDYICNEALEIIRKSNANIIFYDHTIINTKELIVEMANKNADMIIIVNYFGKVKNLENFFINSIKKNNIFIIEDNTHCIKASQTNYSDFEIYSPHKLFGIPDGSIIKFNDENIFNKFKKNFSKNYLKYIKKSLIKYPLFLEYFIKRLTRKFIGYKYPQLNFKLSSSRKKIIRKNANPISIKLLSNYYLKLDRYINIRIKNYNTWQNNLKLIIPFIEMENLNYAPYIGIIKFQNTKERSNILKQYNNYGLPIGNWPDLPKEVIESKKNFIEAKEKYRNQLTIPLHQDIESNQIINCIKKSFLKYIKSFNLEYDEKSKKIKIYDKKNFIGMIIILYNPITKQYILRLKFSKQFHNIYQYSKSFLYKFSIEIINQLKIKEEIYISDEFFEISNYSKFKYKNIRDNIIPLCINTKKIKNHVYSFHKITYIKKEINSEKIYNCELIFTEKVENTNKLRVEIIKKTTNTLISINHLRKCGNHIILEKSQVIDKNTEVWDHLIILCIHLKKLKFNYLKINKNYNT